MRDDLMFDVAVVGAGPAGLAFTRSLAGAGLTIALIEGQDEAALRRCAISNWPVYQARHAASSAQLAMTNAMGTAVPLCSHPTDAEANAATQNCRLPINAEASPA